MREQLTVADFVAGLVAKAALYFKRAHCTCTVVLRFFITVASHMSLTVPLNVTRQTSVTA